ncbi:hypothetical protein, partial [Mesorhizobium sp. M7A.F.Ca.CA.001.15.1.1]|uniref:hypothetical protein n=1 Tax=Mesorhizobium sp. M7A.F.Ca.CA.001.15.1.1 TaxID=2496713 RepID=UPI0019D152A2
ARQRGQQQIRERERCHVGYSQQLGNTIVCQVTDARARKFCQLNQATKRLKPRRYYSPARISPKFQVATAVP